MPSTTRTRQITESLKAGNVDPFEIAAEAIERGDRLLDQVNRLQKILAQVPDLKVRGPHCSGLCSNQ